MAQLEGLGEALLDFSELSDLDAWLRELQTGVARVLDVLEGLQRQLGELSPEIRTEVQAWSLEQLVALDREFSHWSNLTQVQSWLEEQMAQEESFS